MDVESCFLCGADVSDSTKKAKKRKLHGAASKKALEFIDSLAITNFSRQVSTMASSQDSFICHKCKKKAEDIPDLLERAKSLENELLENLKNVIYYQQNRLINNNRLPIPSRERHKYIFS